MLPTLLENRGPRPMHARLVLAPVTMKLVLELHRPSSPTVTPHSTVPALPNTRGKALVGREVSADVPSGAINAVKGAPAEKAKRKPKKKGWKGWALVYYDDDGNVIEERLRDETPQDERFMTSLLPETRPSRGACRCQGGYDGSYRRKE
jgi:hypothetical protein